MMAAVARQWFGAFMRPRAASDQWLIAGLAGWLEGQIVKGFQGRTELLYRSGPASHCLNASSLALLSVAATTTMACNVQLKAQHSTLNTLQPKAVSLPWTSSGSSGTRSAIVAYGRRWRERQTIYTLDDGAAPPLCPQGAGSATAWGRLMGTHALDPSGLLACKATAVKHPGTAASCSFKCH